MKNKREILFFLILAAAIIFKAIYFENIFYKALYDFDEARYAEVAKNMLKTHNIIVPLAGGPDDYRALTYTKLPNGAALYPYFWKPPLHTLVMASSMAVFGWNEFGVRFPALIFAILSTILVFYLTKTLFPNHILTPFLACIFFISLNDFSVISSQGLAETQLLFFSLASIFFALRRTEKGTVVSALFFGLAFMTKSFITFWIPPVIFFIVFQKNIKTFFASILLFLGVSVVVILPWHIYMWILFKQVFIERYVITNIFGRAAGVQNAAPIQWYLIYMLDQWKPFVFLLPAFSFFHIQEIKIRRRSLLLLLFWIAIIFVPLSIAKSKVFWYIFPIWVPFSVLLGYFLEEAFNTKKYLVLAMTFALAITSLHPFWQLSTSHIPLRQFIVFSTTLCGISYMLRARHVAATRYMLVISVLSIFLIGQYFAIKESFHRTDWNKDLKYLLTRNHEMTHVYIEGMPYESALFYSDVGNLEYGSDLKNKYLIIPQQNFDTDKKRHYLIKDRQGNFLILQKK